ncbi:MAG TPA: ribosome small subunit-dependent GTPase A [Thiolinea sp.]|nr:ribosome small subunit-dependent GTPase A [Thiolinea sp.]
MMEQNTGRVSVRYGAELMLETPAGETLRCTARRKLEHVACGDYVRWEKQEQGNAAVTEILPRHNVLTRPDFRGRPRPVAANIDLLLVVNSWQPAPNWEMLDRYLIAAGQLPGEALIILNKHDLFDPVRDGPALNCLNEYRQIGYPVLFTSSRTREGLESLYDHIAGKTAIMTGQSGVGKSSLASWLLPEQDIRIGAIAETGEGRHTTTAAQLYHLPRGGALIDSPGVRDFALPPLSLAELQAGYPEFLALDRYCRFNNCTHHHEPGCEVKKAVSVGQLPEKRYQRYLGLLDRQQS